MLLGKIRLDGGTQVRFGINGDVAKEYTAKLTEGDSFDFPEVIVFFDGTDHWLADGFHRHGAYLVAQRAEIPVKVIPGTKRDALKYALGANEQHGLRRTREERRRAIKIALDDEEWGQWSDNQIGKLCAVSP